MRKVTFICLLFVCFCSNAQHGKLYTEFRVGLNIEYFYSLRKSKFYPGIQAFAGLVTNYEFDSSLWSLNYSPTISIYQKTLGNNMNPLVNDLQIDLTNYVGAGLSSDSITYPKYARSINNSPYYNVRTESCNSIYLGSNFILNNHRRNQAIASLNFNVSNISVNYYNDLGFLFIRGFFGDNFDRWWTGGGTLFVHRKESEFIPNHFEYSFDQFTGFAPLSYEIGTLLGMDVRHYDENTDSLFNNSDDKFLQYTSSAYNSARHKFKFSFGGDSPLEYSIGFMGDLKRFNESLESYRFWSIQDWIHIKGNSPMHPNYDVNKIFFGIGTHPYSYDLKKN
ncbi:MAG: hypothetical protein H7Y00_09690 [Fimbriimonadaceae bacterium]|nr:hypothetical protein [Chitinophagales bacterium]